MTKVAVPKHLQFSAPTQLSFISQMPEDHVCTHSILRGSVSEVKLCPLDSSYKFNRMPQLRIFQMEMAQLYVLFLSCGEAVENF